MDSADYAEINAGVFEMLKKSGEKIVNDLHQSL